MAAAALRELSQMDGQPRNVMLLAQAVDALASRPPKPVDIWFQARQLAPESKWLFEFNRSLATGGLEELEGEVRACMLAAMLAFSTEQYPLARRHLVKATGNGCRSPLLFWLEGMAWQAEGNKELADAALKRAADLQPRLSWGSLEPHVELSIDGARQGTTPRQLRLLPGAHLVRYEKNGTQPREEIISLRSGENRHLQFPPSNGSEQLREEAATIGESKTQCLL